VVVDRKLKVVILPVSVVQYCRQPFGGLATKNQDLIIYRIRIKFWIRNGVLDLDRNGIRTRYEIKIIMY
jgi:hypothetical protein